MTDFLLPPARAALLEAACRARNLSHRYGHALEHLVEESDARALLESALRDHDAMAAALDRLARDHELLPREPDLEIEDLQKIGDQISRWLDTSQTAGLLGKFGDQEACLLEELRAAADDDSLANSIEPWQETVQQHIRRMHQYPESAAS